MATKKAAKSKVGAKAKRVQGHDIVVIGASAGGVQAVTTLLGTLPRRLPAAVFIVYHIGLEAPGNFD